MKGSKIDKDVLKLYRSYAVYHADVLVVNRETSRNIIGVVSEMVEYRTGKRIGKLIVDRLGEGGNVLDESLSVLERSGWGKINVDDEGKVCRVHHAFVSRYYAKHVGTSEKPIDDLMGGVLSAIFEAATGKECDVEETKCMAVGDEFCEFHITSKDETD